MVCTHGTPVFSKVALWQNYDKKADEWITKRGKNRKCTRNYPGHCSAIIISSWFALYYCRLPAELAQRRCTLSLNHGLARCHYNRAVWSLLARHSMMMTKFLQTAFAVWYVCQGFGAAIGRFLWPGWCWWTTRRLTMISSAWGVPVCAWQKGSGVYIYYYHYKYIFAISCQDIRFVSALVLGVLHYLLHFSYFCLLGAHWEVFTLVPYSATKKLSIAQRLGENIKHNTSSSDRWTHAVNYRFQQRR